MVDTSIREKLHAISGFHSKPTRWTDVGLPIPFSLLEQLPQYTAAELGIEHNIAATFTRTPPSTVFLVGYRGGVYLVNTEGSNYARYVRYAGTDTVYAGAPIADAPLKTGQLTTDRVFKALRDTGYDPDGIHYAKFVQYNKDGKEQHEIGFESEDHPRDKGFVYVWKENGVMRADF